MNKGDKILMQDGVIMEFVGRVLPAGNELKFLWRFEALDKHRYVEMSFESALTCRIAYLEHQVRAMELGIPGFWLYQGNLFNPGEDVSTNPEIHAHKPIVDEYDFIEHYTFKDGEWVADGED